ncbi:MAG: prohibitin family protein [Acidobacteria bacterium]|nr:prohibitin family protein [Acidobacteriota bacterium]MBI3656738.1 prohibitin family protein [Acidobacteriota bacterium]
MSFRDINMGRNPEGPMGFRFSQNPLRWILLGLAAFILFGVLRETFLFVEPTKMAVVVNRFSGQLSSRRPGFYFLMPGVQESYLYDVTEQSYTMVRKHAEGQEMGDDSIQCLTSDGLSVFLDITVRYQLDPDRIADLHRRFGVAYVNKIVRPQINSVVRSIVSKYSIVDVYSGKRAQIQSEVTTSLFDDMNRNVIILKEVLLRDVNLTPEFHKAIEQKQIAQQEAQRKQYELERERVEKERKIIEAQGEAESMSLKGKALAQNPALIQYQYVTKIAPGVQTIITDGRSIMSLGDVLGSSKAAKP